jgi:hypothetical protein
MKKYDVISFHQYGSSLANDELLMFAANARDINSWAGIPRKGWQIRMLFQRPITPTRDSDLKKFWNQASTPEPGDEYIVGPSAIIVAVQGFPNIENGKINLEYKCPVDLLKNSNQVIQDLAKLLMPKVSLRLSVDQQQNINDRTGHEFTIFPDIGSDYVFEFALQLQQMIVDAERFIDQNSIDQNGITEIISSMEAVLRPAIVVDGQHRLHGASNANNQIILPVIAIPHCSWTEQIYQFVVINEKAQRVDPSLLSDIFGSSLTSTEQQKIRNKLKRSNVEIESRIASVLANRESESPFNNMVVVKMEGKLPDGVNPYISERTIRVLIEGSSQKYSLGWKTDENFYKYYIHPTIQIREDWDSWSDGKWMNYWFAFWAEVRDFYNSQSKNELWNTQILSNLTKAVALRQLQTLFMNYCVETMKQIDKSRETLIEVLKDYDLVEQKLSEQRKLKSLPLDINDFKTFVREKFLKTGIEAKVFQATWKSSLDDAQGQEELWDTLSTAFERHQKGEAFRVTGRIFDANEAKIK